MQDWISLSSFAFFFQSSATHRDLHSFPTRRSSDLVSTPSRSSASAKAGSAATCRCTSSLKLRVSVDIRFSLPRSEEHTSELQSHHDLVCRLLLEKKKQQTKQHHNTPLYSLCNTQHD